jgi:hypothetical protein
VGLRKLSSVVKNPDGRLEAFAISTDKKAYRVAQTEPNGKWGKWQDFTEQISKNLKVSQNQDGRLTIFGVGSGQKLYQAWQTKLNGKDWSKWVLRNIFVREEET